MSVKTVVGILFFLTVCVESFAAPAGGGGEVGNGGDAVAIEFVAMARLAVRRIGNLPEESRYGLSLSELDRAVETTKVESVNRPLFLGGAEKAAVNFPEERRILVSRPAWGRIKNMNLRRRLVLHEYLGILAIPDGNYQISERIYPGGLYEGNPCDGGEETLRKDTAARFAENGYAIREDVLSISSEVETFEGGRLLILRGFESSRIGHPKALMVIGQCDPAKGKYEILETWIGLARESRR